MPPRVWRERVEDILASVNRILEYTAGLDERAFRSDPRTIDAVVRNLEVIGEAARHVPDRVRERFPDVPWIDMRDMRNLLSHAYFTIDVAVVWRTVQDDLPALVPAIERILASSD